MFAARNNASVFASLAVACSLLLFSPSGLAADESLVLAPDGSYRVDSVLYTRLDPGYWRGYSGTQYLTALANVVVKDVATRCGRPFQFRQSASGAFSTYWDVGANMDGCVADFVANYISRPHTVSTLTPPQLQQNSSGTPYTSPPAGERWLWKTSVYGRPYSRDAYSAYFELQGYPGILVCSVLAPVRSADTGGCSCPGEIRYSAIFRGDRCFPMERYRLEITTVTPGGSLPDIELEPEATVELMVRVFDAQDRPVPFVQVRIEVSVDATSGGHDHGGADRPRGILSGFNGASAVAGPTDAAGAYYFSFTAPAAAGDHVLAVTCVSHSCNTITEDVWVGVKDLIRLMGSNYGNYVLVTKAEDLHQDNHYLTVMAASRLSVISDTYHHRFPGAPVLHLNDAGLERGGVFDISGNWKSGPKGHKDHGRGKTIDIRANNLVTAIPAENFLAFEELAKEFKAQAGLHCTKIKVSDGSMQCDPDDTNRHFHVRLVD